MSDEDHVSLRLWACLAPFVFAILSCHGSGKPAWQRTQPLEGLATETAVISESAAGAETAIIHVRPVLVQPRKLLEQRVAVAEPGEKEFLVPGEQQLPVGVAGADVQLRGARGGPASRPAKLQFKKNGLSVAVDFTATDLGTPLDMTVTARVPWPPLRAETQAFKIERGAHLQFATALKAPKSTVVPTRAQFRVSLELAAGASVLIHQSQLMQSETDSDLGWNDVEVDLSPYAGQTGRLIFESSRAGVVADVPSALALPLISEPVVVSLLPREQRRNVVLVSIDTLRADHVGAYGYPRATSPLIDRLAAQGTACLETFAIWPETSASHMTMFTSLYPSVHGVGITRFGVRAAPPWLPRLAEVLGRHGYVTAGFTEDGLLAHAAGFSQGFVTYREFLKPKTFVSAAAVADKVFGAGARWLREHRDDVFFLFLHTYQVHERAAPGDFYAALRNQFKDDAVPAVNAKAAEQMRAYDAAIRYTDEALVGVIRTLEELHLADKTLVIVTSDHGEEFGTHDAYGHGSNLFDFALRVPLVLWSPGFIPEGKQVRGQVGLIDLMPTVLELLALPPLPEAQGVSFARAVLADSAPVSRPLFFELANELRAARYPDYKVIWKPGDNDSADYYDLQQDPDEAQRRDGAAPRVAQAVALLRQHDLESTAYRDQLAAAAGGASVSAVIPVDAATLDHMRALGYHVPQAP